MMWTIYKITNKANGLSYIGCTTWEPEQRLRRHIHLAKYEDRRGINSHFLKAIHDNKHVFEDFEVRSLATAATLKKAHAEEIAQIAIHNTLTPHGYNHSKGGYTGPGAVEQSSRSKQGEAMKRRWADPEYKARVSKALRKAQTSEMIARRNAAISAAHSTDAAKLKISERTKQQWADPETKRKMMKGFERVRDSENRKRAAVNALRSPEVRAKLSSAVKAWWDARKAKEHQS